MKQEVEPSPPLRGRGQGEGGASARLTGSLERTADLRLIVELDGGIHTLTTERDAAREAWLIAHGYRVLHFDNAAVIQDRETVLLTIEQHCQNKR